jgi:hypothetical protein
VFDSTTSFDDFLAMIAQSTPCNLRAIAVPKLMWKSEKPLNDTQKPIGTKVGYDAMIRQNLGKKKDHAILLFMPQPAALQENVVRDYSDA